METCWAERLPFIIRATHEDGASAVDFICFHTIKLQSEFKPVLDCCFGAYQCFLPYEGFSGHSVTAAELIKEVMAV